MATWPVQFILHTSDWQRGYEAAMRRYDDLEPLDNPYSPDLAEFYGFEEGRLDADRIGKGDA